ncbi:hypothetical protein [Arthrobacter sp. STN4]|uniref:hypothetical protein n=1 Tax=Arthrobacter sp. STN4 TaxID=2923276 RepID=UPI00211A3F40|nr:hypothetical protein [Arthrobacter sp. STN4]MCQ9163651.1 hypothetical protein [Arthrobacter sp. STN4]
MDQKSSVGLDHYWVVIRRQWKTIVALTTIGILAAVGYLSLAPAQVTATTLLNVNVIVSDPFNPSKASSALLDATTETQLATSHAIAKAAAAAMPHGDGVDALRSGVAVTTDANATTLKITYTSSTPQLARSGADAIATAYLNYRHTQALTKQRKLQGQLEGQLAALDKRLASATPSQAPSLLTQIGSVQSHLNVLSLIDTEGGTILNPAEENAVSYQPRPAIVVATGLFSGLALGLVIAFVFNVLDRRVRDWYDVRGAGAGPVLARLRNAEATIPASGADLDNFRVIRERLLADMGQCMRVLTVIDEAPSLPSDVAANLAVAFAQSGTPVVLVLMGASGESMAPLVGGLQLAVLKSDCNGLTLRSERLKSLTVLRPDAPKEDFGADDFVTELVRSEIIGQAPGTLVLLALPPHAPHASRLAAARLSDAVLLVAECHRTKIDELARDASEMAELQSTVVGTVLVPTGRNAVESRGQKKAGRLHHEKESVGARY